MGVKRELKEPEDILLKVSEIMKPLFKNNGVVNIDQLKSRNELEYFLAQLMNTKFTSNKNKQGWNFGADEVIAIQIKIEKNNELKYFGKIKWISTPKNHQCYKSYLDPFYGVFKYENNKIKIQEFVFGDYDRTDLDNENWINAEINWMYDL